MLMLAAFGFGCGIYGLCFLFFRTAWKQASDDSALLAAFVGSAIGVAVGLGTVIGCSLIPR